MSKFARDRKLVRQFVKSGEDVLVLPFDCLREEASVYWHKVLKINFFRLVFKYVVLALTRHMPSGALKNFLLRRLGVRIGKKVFIGVGAILDVQFPELITIEDNVIIGIDSHILTHEVTHTHVRLARVRICKNALIGAMSIIRGGVTVGENSVVGMGVLIFKDVDPNTMVLGEPTRIVKTLEGQV